METQYSKGCGQTVNFFYKDFTTTEICNLQIKGKDVI